MSLRGERFTVNLDDSDEEDLSEVPARPPPQLPGSNIVHDVIERTPAAPKPPSAPTLKATKTGFPVHKKISKPSLFKAQRNGGKAEQQKSSASNEKVVPARALHSLKEDENLSFEERQKHDIDMQNQRLLESMSPEEIQEAREDLFSQAAFTPRLAELLMKRAKIHEDEADESGWVQAGARGHQPTSVDEEEPLNENKEKKRVAFADLGTPNATGTVTITKPNIETREERSMTESPSDNLESSKPPIHFPSPPQPPDLDPDDPSFLQNLHTKYFPSLPYNPSDLEWMTAGTTSSSNDSSSYSPHLSSLAPSSIRFDFRGLLIPPSKSSQLPVTAGLHHHGDAPESAGYTIPELAMLARSTVPGQRCVAFQTLGRLLYRLGKGEYGGDIEAGKQGLDPAIEAAMKGEVDDEAEDDDEEVALASGLWDCVEREHVTEILMQAVNKERHVSARTYAEEAVWNWKKGGGRKKKAL
jgi:RNA polymerase II-associated protein 1